MSDNFVICRHCGVGINYRCDHDEPDDDDDRDAATSRAMKADAALAAKDERIEKLTEDLRYTLDDLAAIDTIPLMTAGFAFAQHMIGRCRIRLDALLKEGRG